MNSNTTRRIVPVVLVCSAALATACGSAPTTSEAPAKPKATAAKPAPEPRGMTVAPRVCNGRKLVGAMVEELAQQAKTAEDEKLAKQDEDDAKFAAPPPPDRGKNAGSFEAAYRQIAPATVLIKTDDGFGTGVIVDKSGLILTNYHVVANGLQKDFRIKVGVNYGKPSGVGGMDVEEKTHEGWVVKADRVRDLALIRVKDAPKNVKVATVAQGDPTPGQSIAAVGHAGIGMLWAMKTCHVAAIGEPAKNGILAAKDCSSQPGSESLSEDELKDRKKRCEEAKKQAQLAAAEIHGGLFVQSDCRIAPGDSGGPLIDDKAHIVGLNQSVTSDRSTAGGTSYHVHVAELRDFIKDPPQNHLFHTPDPWCDGGTETSLEDLDMDGAADGLIASGYDHSYFYSSRRQAVFMDLDGKQLPEPGSKSQMPFDAEAAYLTVPQGTFAWYDSDNDGRFDILVADAKDSGKRVAYDIAVDSTLTERKNSSSVHFFDDSFIKDEKMHVPLGRWAAAVAPYHASSHLLADAKRQVTVPDPFAGISPKGAFADVDRNGKLDGYRFSSMFGSGLVLDVDGDSLSGVSPKDEAEPFIKARKLDPELSFIVENGSSWVVYDRDNDKVADLAIVPDTRSVDRIAKSAYTRKSASDPWKQVSDFNGARSVRAGLLSVPDGGELVKAAWPFAARREGLSAFPRAVSRKASYDYAKGAKSIFPNKQVLLGQRSGYSMWVFDADNDSKPGTKAANELIQDKKFDAEVASVLDTSANLIWVHYDTDHDGTFDLVLYSSRPESGNAEKAFRIEKDKVTVDNELGRGKLYRASLLQDKLAAAGFKKLATEFLRENAVAD